MDLERIKQQFRIRSGRNKKKQIGRSLASPSKPQTAPAESPTEVTNNERPEQDKQQQQQQQQQQEATEAPSAASEVPEDSEKPDQLEDVKPEVSETQVNGDTLHQENTSLVEEATYKQEEPRPNGISEEDDLDERSSIEEAPFEEHQTPQQDPTEQEDTMAPNSEHTPSSEAGDFDLDPPAPRPKPPSIEGICDLLWSEGHLNFLLHSPPQLARFTSFLHKYRPDDYPLLQQFIETQKAIKAVEYANAIACGLKPQNTGSGIPVETTKQAAELDATFSRVRDAAFDALVNTALPMYVTYNLVKVVSEYLTNEITGRMTPMMNEMVGGLSEVFCLTDPNQEDNPIIYASEEFYRFTGYGQEEVIGHNCRFLQGRKTNPASPKRLKDAVKSGAELCETLLNYRRNGKPFINMLMIAPLHDSNGKVKYHIGAQVDVSGLIEHGRGVESFSRFLIKRDLDLRRARSELKHQHLNDEQRRKRTALAKLRDLSEMFDLEESAIVQASSRSTSRTREDDDLRSNASTERPRTARRRLDDDDASDPDEDDVHQEKKDSADWKLGESGQGRLSGTLPGIYENFMLVRPAPSLRIVFVSPRLRKMGNILQSPFLSHVAGPATILRGLKESLSIGVPVSAKIHFAAERSENRDGTKLKNGTRHEDGKHGRAVWISCTPLLGADDRVGVWMVVFVQKSKIGGLNKRLETSQADSQEKPVSPGSTIKRTGRPTKIELPKRQTALEDVPIKPVRNHHGTSLEGTVKHNFERSQNTDTDYQLHFRDESQRADEFSELQKMPEPANGHADHDLQRRSEAMNVISNEVKPEDSISDQELRTRSRSDSRTSRGSIGERSEGFVTTRSPQRFGMINDRVVIEDSDTASDLHDPEMTSSISHSPVWSPASEHPSSPPTVKYRKSSHRGSDSQAQTRTNYGTDTPTHVSDEQRSPSSPEASFTMGYQGLGEDKRSPLTYREHFAMMQGEASDGEEDSPVNRQIRSNTARMSSSMRLDYLRHPGSRRWGTQHASGEDDKISDLDCARSPYSVD